VLGPYLLPEKLTAQRYRDLLENILQRFLEDVPLAVRKRMGLQHDGAPAHFGEGVWQSLNATYPGRWTGRGGPIIWSPRSPDLTPTDFYLKEYVYTVPLRTIEDLVTGRQAAITTVDVNMSRCVRDSSVLRTAACLEIDGGRFEHLLQLQGAHGFIIDYLRHLTVTCILKTKCHGTCIFF
jgi:hypothetical protein